jgi:hypothetical protein
MPLDDLGRTFEETVWQPLQRAMAGILQIQPEEMPRLATFLAAHGAIDMLLAWIIREK